MDSYFFDKNFLSNPFRYIFQIGICIPIFILLLLLGDVVLRAPIVIAVAGMDAALPTVLGGLVSGALIAVPTSVGYGVARNGETALMSCLVSCAPGITVCNINNGYGAAIAALRILRASRDIKVKGYKWK